MRLFLSVTLSFLISTQSVLACACCVDKGERFARVEPLDAYVQEQFNALGNLGPIRVFTTVCGLDCVSGIDDPKEVYDGAVTVRGGLFRVDLGTSGILEVPIGAAYDRFGVDLDPMSDGPADQIYSEFRFFSQLGASGDFAPADGARADLVFSGRTNACWLAGDLTHWTLDVSGPGVTFRLFGALSP